MEAFAEAVRNKNFVILKEYLDDKNFDFLKENEDMITPLHYVIDSDDLDILDFFLESSRINYGATFESRILRDLVGKGINNLLHYAAKKNKTVSLSFLMKHYPNLVDHKTQTGDTVLMIACRNGSLECAKLLIECGNGNVIPDQRNFHGNSALDEAVKYPELVKYLVKEVGVSLAPSPTGQTALHPACIRGPLESVEILLEAGVDVNSQNEVGNTALMVSAIRRDLAICKLLVDHGAGLYIQDTRGFTSYSYAVTSDFDDFEKNFPCTDAELELVLIDAVREHRMHMITRWMIERDNFTTVIMDKMADRALVNASDKGFLDIIKLFISYRVNNVTSLITSVRSSIMSKGGNGIECALYILKELKQHNKILSKDEIDQILLVFGGSCTIGKIELVQQLHQDFKLDLNSQIPLFNGNTPLGCAAQSGHVEIIKYLVENGADINMPSMDGCVPVLHAAICGNIEAVRYIVSSGANMNVIPQKATLIPFIAYFKYVAMMASESESEEESEENDQDIRDSRLNCEQIGLELLKGNMNVNSTASEGMSPLVATIVYRTEASLWSRLLELGADPWMRCPDGNSAVHYLFFASNIEFLKFSLENNYINVEQCVSRKNSAGLSPLELALNRENSNVIGGLMSIMPELNDFLDFHKIMLKHSELYGGASGSSPSWNCCTSTRKPKYRVLDGEEFCVVCKKQYGNDDDCVILHCDHMIHSSCQGDILNSSGDGSCPFCNEFFIKFNKNNN